MRSAAIGGVCRRRGAALVEIIISLLLIGVAVSAIMILASIGMMLRTSIVIMVSINRDCGEHHRHYGKHDHDC